MAYDVEIHKNGVHLWQSTKEKINLNTCVCALALSLTLSLYFDYSVVYVYTFTRNLSTIQTNEKSDYKSYFQMK